MFLTHRLHGNKLLDEGTIVVCDALRESKVSRIEELDLSYNRIGLLGAESVAAYVAVTTSLTHCDVRHNNIIGEGAQQLASAVLANTKIEVFNEIPIKEMRADSLTTLDLSKKKIGVEGGMVVAGLVPVMASLTKIDVSYNSLGDHGKAALRKAVEGRSSFEIVL